MNVIIPVAGIGTRLRPHTNALPKPLLSVAGSTILDHVLKPILPLALEQVQFVIGYKGDMIRRYVLDSYDFDAHFVEQDKLLGLGYAVRVGLEQLDDGPVLILLGDTIVNAGLSSLAGSEHNVLGICHVKDPRRFGVAEITDGFITDLVEKPSDPKSDLALVGLYYFTDAAPLRKALDDLVQSGHKTCNEIQLTDALATMIVAGEKFVPLEVKQWYDCGKKETMLESNRHLLARLDAAPKVAGSEIIPPVLIAPTAEILDSTIGPNVTIADGCRVIESTVTNSIIGDGATLEQADVRDSLIGAGASVTGITGVFNIGQCAEVGLPRESGPAVK